MANWMTADEISERYTVGEQRLLAYGFRGNLPMRREPDGATRFDAEVVARLFRPRSGVVLSAPPPRTPNLGVLGVTPLGERQEAAPAVHARLDPRRALRGDEAQEAPPLRRAG